MFKCCNSDYSRGFHITFENGWTVSVQFAPGNYCENRRLDFKNSPNQCKDAEIAAWDSNGDWYKFAHDTVEGWQTPNQVLEFMNTISKLPPSVKKESANES